MSRRPRFAVLPLAVRDLRHELVLNLCLVLALAAVLAPLLLLMGLKNGTVETLRDRLVRDPVYREIKPRETLRLDAAWFAALQGRSDVGFLAPTILRGASIVRLGRPGSSDSELVDLIPSAAGDPLLVDNGVPVPAAGEAVLTALLAEKLGAQAGETLSLKVNRVRDGRREQAVQDLRIVGVLPVNADGTLRVYAETALTLDAEAYREGLAVPERGWDGGTATPPMAFDGVLVAGPQRLDALTAGRLTVGTGFAVQEEVDAATFTARTGLPLPEGYAVLAVRGVERPAGLEAVDAIRGKLRGVEVAVLPYVADPPVLRIGGADVAVAGFSPTAKDLRVLDLPPPPWPALADGQTFAAEARLLLPPGVAADTAATLAVRTEVSRLDVPLAVQPGAAPGAAALVPVELLARLRTAAERAVTLTPDQGLVLERGVFRGFRLYARDIDSVPALHAHLQSLGIETVAKLDVIERLRILDLGLTRMFAIIAAVGLTGAAAALVANFYASVDRKKRDLAMLRLMGLDRLDVWRFPIVQGLLLGGVASLLAVATYLALAAVINGLFPADFDLGSEICRLPPLALVLAVVAAVAMAGASSLLAAWKSSRLDPAEAIRVE
ncbi:FtsX-like permease family protein [Caenispirillum bisanense]|uniref:ABC transporter permease n=1 Tax=Caenispirillum bisanense TaxID=414052 RepID=UPI0031D31892